MLFLRAALAVLGTGQAYFKVVCLGLMDRDMLRANGLPAKLRRSTGRSSPLLRVERRVERRRGPASPQTGVGSDTSLSPYTRASRSNSHARFQRTRGRLFSGSMARHIAKRL
jgi:hypothetical protein